MHRSASRRCLCVDGCICSYRRGVAERWSSGFIATPAASAQQSVNFYMGGFVPTSADARGDIAGGISNDVLVQNQQFLSLPHKRLRRIHVRRRVAGSAAATSSTRASVSASFRRPCTRSTRTSSTSTAARCVANLKLRIVPFTATFRCPAARPRRADPAVRRRRRRRLRLAVQRVRTVRRSRRPQHLQRQLRRQRHGDVGPVVLGGVRVPIGPTAAGFEARWQSAKGDAAAEPGALPARRSISAG